MAEQSRHIPVLMREVVSHLQVQSGGRYLDCTLGGGGHCHAILDANPDNTVTALDRDQAAIDRFRVRFSDDLSRVRLLQGDFGSLSAQLREEESHQFHGMLADLGVSTDQLFDGRGVSFRDSTPLDMRMDQSQEFSAQQVVNEYGERELFRALKEGGVGKDAWKVVQAIVRNRPVETTDELASLIADAVSWKTHQKSVHPATVVFQAIRMEVNGERDQIQQLLAEAPGLVRSGGRLAVICFHSLEDKLVAKTMRSWEGERPPANVTATGGVTERKAIGKLITRKAIAPESEEIEGNPKARSARLRVFEFL